MSIIQLLVMSMGIMLMLILGYAAFAGPSPAKESARRLQAVRFRHSDWCSSFPPHSLLISE